MNVSLSMPTETHGKDSSSQLLQLPWGCVAIKHKTLFPRSHAKFHGVRSELQSTVTSPEIAPGTHRLLSLSCVLGSLTMLDVVSTLVLSIAIWLEDLGLEEDIQQFLSGL